MAYEWSVAPTGTCVIATPTSANTSITCNDNFSGTVTLKVTDDETAEATSNATITIANVAPTATGVTAPGSVNEGSNIVFSVTGVTDPSTADVAAGFQYAFSCDGSTPSSFSSTNSKTCGTTDDGTMTVKAAVKDKDGGVSAVVSQSVTVNNVAPTATFNAPSPVNEGSAISLSLTSPVDPSSADVAAGFEYAFDCGSGYGSYAATNTASCPTNDNGSRTVKGKIRDKDGGETEYDAPVIINNVASTAYFSAPSSVSEGSNIVLSLANPIDPSSVDATAGFQYAFDCGDGNGYGAYGTATSRTCPTTDNGPRTVRGKIKDKDNGETPYTASVTVNNVAPIINTPLNIPVTPIAAGSTLNLTWTFTDPGADTWQCKISWDQPVSFGALFSSTSDSDGDAKSCTASTSTLPAGIYTVTVYVKDDDNGEDQETATAYIVVYDPSAGFVTGGGWINSLPGAYRLDLSAGGKANFGFVSKYKKGMTVPDGNTEFQFHAGSLNFKSTAYEWLVVASYKAQFKGVGTINGTGTYYFLLSAIDGQINGGGGADKFRMKIWRLNGTVEEVIYDNQLNAELDAEPTTMLGGGSINIQAK